MRLDGFAEAELKDDFVLRVDDANIAVWIAHPQHGEMWGMAWLTLSAGNIDAKNPDEAMIQKMWRIAESLSAHLQGDEGELYGADGQVI